MQSVQLCFFKIWVWYIVLLYFHNLFQGLKRSSLIFLSALKWWHAPRNVNSCFYVLDEQPRSFVAEVGISRNKFFIWCVSESGLCYISSAMYLQIWSYDGFHSVSGVLFGPVMAGFSSITHHLEPPFGNGQKISKIVLMLTNWSQLHQRWSAQLLPQKTKKLWKENMKPI